MNKLRSAVSDVNMMLSCKQFVFIERLCTMPSNVSVLAVFSCDRMLASAYVCVSEQCLHGNTAICVAGLKERICTVAIGYIQEHPEDYTLS